MDEPYGLDVGTPECSTAVSGLAGLVAKLAGLDGVSLDEQDRRHVCGYPFRGFGNAVFGMYPPVFDARCTCDSPNPDDYTSGDHAFGCQLNGPNFHCGDVVIRWYKTIGRGMTVNRPVTREELAELFRRCDESLA